MKMLCTIQATSAISRTEITSFSWEILSVTFAWQTEQPSAATYFVLAFSTTRFVYLAIKTIFQMSIFIYTSTQGHPVCIGIDLEGHFGSSLCTHPQYLRNAHAFMSFYHIYPFPQIWVCPPMFLTSLRLWKIYNKKVEKKFFLIDHLTFLYFSISLN